MDLIKGLVHTEINQKLQSTDKIVHENIGRLVHSKVEFILSFPVSE
jgi:hypothetical protein